MISPANRSDNKEAKERNAKDFRLEGGQSNKSKKSKQGGDDGESEKEEGELKHNEVGA